MHLFFFVHLFRGKVPKAWAVSDAGPPREGFSCIRPPWGCVARGLLGLRPCRSRRRRRRRSRPPGRLRSYCKAVACSTRPPMALPYPRRRQLLTLLLKLHHSPLRPQFQRASRPHCSGRTHKTDGGGIRAATRFPRKVPARLHPQRVLSKGSSRCLHPFPLWGSHQRPRAHANGRRR